MSSAWGTAKGERTVTSFEKCPRPPTLFNPFVSVPVVPKPPPCALNESYTKRVRIHTQTPAAPMSESA